MLSVLLLMSCVRSYEPKRDSEYERAESEQKKNTIARWIYVL